TRNSVGRRAGAACALPETMRFACVCLLAGCVGASGGGAFDAAPFDGWIDFDGSTDRDGGPALEDALSSSLPPCPPEDTPEPPLSPLPAGGAACPSNGCAPTLLLPAGTAGA